MELVILIGQSETVFYPLSHARVIDVVDACQALVNIGIRARIEMREKK